MKSVPALAVVTGAVALFAAACSQAETPAAVPAEDTAVPAAATAPAADAASTDIVAAASNTPSLSTLVTAIKAAGLVETLQGPGPFTVFAPTNDAFGKLPAGAVDNLLKPEQKSALTKVLTYHVVPGRLTAADIAAQAGANGGKATLTTVEGSTLTVTDAGGGQWKITDEKGGSAMIATADLAQSNGVVHVIDTVLMPN